MANRTGGCLCGAVRYRLDGEPFDCGWCHCRTCQLNSGAPAMAFASVRAGDWVVTAGDLPRYDRFRPGTVGLEGTKPPN